ncbi:hypothetical protein [Orenia marismortui]|uniref:hypothetical protein n=1 Tax=Orenia marismortui TaxID=46469 RepID=UPI000361F729|nr:hypothetical protein [Orenia marismortui]
MLFNILLGFVLPWILGVMIYKKSSKIILFIAPVSAVVANIINTIFIYYEFWSVKPDTAKGLERLPYDTGVYAVAGSAMVYLINYHRVNNYIVILLISLITTLGEGLLLLINRVSYHKGWNIYLTFLSYLFAYIVVYIYYLMIKEEKL